ncbi:hypothetical protein [Parasphingorhabdus pacifica]
MRSARAKRTRSRPGWRGRRALRSAQVLDDVVNSQLRLVPHLSAEARRESADYLAELVMLAQVYRHFAAGWISRHELEHRGNAAMHRLAGLRSPSGQQLAERE